MQSILLLFSIFIAPLYGTQAKIPSQLSLFSVNVYATPIASSSAQNEVLTTQEQMATNTNANTTTTEVNEHVTLNTIMSSMQKAAEEIPSLWTQFQDECTNHKWHIVGGTALIGYGILFGILVRDALYLNDAHLWSRWKYDTPLTSLCIMDQETLCKELIITIQERHLDIQNPTDCIKPLTRFITAVEQEKKRLQTYCTRANWLKRCYLFKITPINDAKIALAGTLLERLDFIHTLFTTWASHYNWNTLV